MAVRNDDSAPPPLGAGWRISVARAGERARQRLLEFTAGGRWTYQLAPTVRDNLRWFYLDGTFANASDAVILAYLSVFVLALGGTRAQIGLMNSLASLSAALILLPGAALVERLGRRKPLVLAGANGARFALLLLALAPFVASGPTVVAVVIGLAIVRTSFVHLGLPAWTSLMGDLVPVSWRGRFFSARSMAMVAAGIVTTLVFGQLISRVRQPLGYQLALGLAFAIGMVATYCYSRISEPAQASEGPAPKGTRFVVWQELGQHRDFLTFALVAALWNFSVTIGGPFFSVFVVESLGANAGFVGTLSVVSSLSALPGHRLFGKLVDTWGARRVQVLTGMLIPVLAFGWAVAQAPWHAVPLFLIGGFLWAGYGVGSLNVQLSLVPPAKRARFTALLSIVVLAGSAAGAAVGGLVAERWGYRAAFAATGVGRLLASLLYLRFVRVPVPPVEGALDPPPG